MTADKFVIGGSEPQLQITITPKDHYGIDNKTLTLTLGALPAGVLAGDNVATITVEPRTQATISFMESNIVMTSNVPISNKASNTYFSI